MLTDDREAKGVTRRNFQTYASTLRDKIREAKSLDYDPVEELINSAEYNNSLDSEGVVAGEKAFSNRTFDEAGGPENVTPPLPIATDLPPNTVDGENSSIGFGFDEDGEIFDSAGYDLFPDFGSEQAGGYEEEAVTDINSELGTFDLDSIDEEAFSSDNFVFPEDEVIKLENLVNDKTLDKTTKKIVDKSKDEAGDNLYYKVLDELNKGNYPEETKKELLERLRAGIRNQGWVRDAVSLGSKAHPVLFLVDKLMIGLVKKDMKEQADLLDGKGLKEGQRAEAVRIQKGRHKGKYVGVVIKEGDKIIEYKGHAVMPNQFDNKDPLYDYILGEGFKPGPDDDDSPAPNDPCPAGYVLSGGSCVPIQSVGEDDETTEDDTTDDDTSEDGTPYTETLDEIIARIRQPPRVPTEPTETFNPITFANKGGAMGIDPLTSGAVTDSLASATQRFLSSLTG